MSDAKPCAGLCRLVTSVELAAFAPAMRRAQLVRAHCRLAAARHGASPPAAVRCAKQLVARGPQAALYGASPAAAVLDAPQSVALGTLGAAGRRAPAEQLMRGAVQFCGILGTGGATLH